MYNSTADIKNIFINEIEKVRKQADNINSSDVKVVVLGLYNHGKSTLLNQLIGDYENKTFSVSDIRETRKEKILKKDNIIYIDTPGLNAEDCDTTEALKNIDSYDIYLYVHKITTGSLQNNESIILSKLSECVGVKEFLSSCIFVLTCAGEANDNDAKKSAEQFRIDLGKVFRLYDASDIDIVLVDSKSYSKGKLENKTLLAKKGGIDNLFKNIISRQHSNLLKERRKQKLINVSEYLITQINEVIEPIDNEIKETKKYYKKRKKQFDKKVDEYNELLY